jgi:hypothetical protein
MALLFVNSLIKMLLLQHPLLLALPQETNGVLAHAPACIEAAEVFSIITRRYSANAAGAVNQRFTPQNRYLWLEYA